MEDGPDDDRRSPGPGGNTTETMIAELRTQLRHTVAMDGQEVLDRLSRGLNEREVLADIEYPSEMFDLPWLTPLYGCPGYIMGDLVREESGRWDRNPNSLHPSPQDEVVRATFDAIDDPDDEPSVVSARAIKGLHKSSRLLLEKGTLAREGVAP